MIRLFGLFLFLSANTVFAQFCVQTFNAYGPFYAPELELRTSELKQYIENDSCDLWQMQEVWKAMHFAQVKDSFTKQQFRSLYFDQQRKDSLKTGLASFVRSYHTAKSYTFPWNNDNGLIDWGRSVMGIQKGFSAILSNLDNEQVLAINTHLHHISEAVRLAQILFIAKTYIEKLPKDVPLLFTGDLNATPGSLELSLLKSLLNISDAYETMHGNYDGICTYCRDNSLSLDNSNRVIDYVLFRASGTTLLAPSFASVNLQHGKSLEYSDHYGVRVYFDIFKYNSQPDISVRTQRTKNALELLERARTIIRNTNISELSSSLKIVQSLKKRLLADSPSDLWLETFEY